MVRRFLLYLIFLLMPLGLCGQPGAPACGTVVVVVTDTLQLPLPYATVVLKTQGAGGKTYAAAADPAGRCFFSVPGGTYEAAVAYIGYEPYRAMIPVAAGQEACHTVRMRMAAVRIREVVVTASESKGATSASVIGRDAMAQLQPSSIGDLFELLPGGRTADPSFAFSDRVHLREVPISSAAYQTSSLGVSFVMDGVPLSNDAALRFQSGSATQSGITSIADRTSLNTGVDMRTMPTDEIATVEIVRGIPSVEYGDLTSGLVKVTRKEGGHDLEARFKADLGSQLFYLGKGFEWGRPADRLTMNLGANWLDARSDPRNTRQQYRRITGSWRLGKKWESASGYRFSFGTSVDYTGSFDRVKSDRNIDEGPTGVPIERYAASYNDLAAALNFSAAAKGQAFLRRFDLKASATAESDRIDRWRYVVLGGNYPIRTAVEEGVYDAQILPNRYEATLRVDGRPFYAFTKASAQLGADTPLSRNTLLVGAEWTMSKNYGAGLVYDVTRPISTLMTTRPRRYDAVPAMHRFSAYAEERTVVSTGRWRFEIMAGLRTTVMANLGGSYALQGKFLFDPRANLSAALPAFDAAGRPMRITLAGGAGWHTKTPTASQLFPDPDYYDYTQLNYYPADASRRRVNRIVYRLDPTNYDLLAARNFKWEVRGDVAWAGNTLSVTYFHENMESGFRTSSSITSFSYRDYDESAVDSLSPGPPSLEGLPYTEETVLETVAGTTNGSRIYKRGVEFTLSTQRIRALATRITVSGAWFRTRYANSEPQYITTSVSLNNKPYPYIGLYAQQDNYVYEVFNTNFMLDTQLPRLGLVFTTSFQCQWFSGSQSQWCDPRPISYVDAQLQSHPFTDESAADGVLQQMIRQPSSIAYLYQRIPFSMYVNLKVTKRLLGGKVAVALFVNRLFDYSPDYTDVTGGVRRRYSDPYFGMELNFKL